MARNILVVDDDPEIVELFSGIINVLGFTPLPFTNPEVAIKNYSRLSVDLIITDYIMPKINGEQMINEIFATNRRVPVIIITGFEEELIFDSDRSAPIVVTEKPFQSDMIKGLIRSSLRLESPP